MDLMHFSFTLNTITNVIKILILKKFVATTYIPIIPIVTRSDIAIAVEIVYAKVNKQKHGYK